MIMLPILYPQLQNCYYHYYYVCYNILFLSKGFPGYHTGYMNPPDQRRTPGAGQYYAEYATINSQGGRSGPNRPPDIPQVTPTMQEYTDYPGKQPCMRSFVKNSLSFDAFKRIVSFLTTKVC